MAVLRTMLAQHQRKQAARRTSLVAALGNNPLQQVAAPLLAKVGSMLGSKNVNILANIGKGAAFGSVFIPDDAAIDPEDPVPALQITGILLGAGAEGALADMAMLQGLEAIRTAATARNALRTAASAEKALRLFGQGEDVSKLRQIVGGAALAGTTEATMRTAVGQGPADVLTNAGLVAVGGAALGGAMVGLGIAARRATAKARSLVSVADTPGTATAKAAEDLLADATNRPAARIEETGVGSRTAHITKMDEDASAIALIKRAEEAPPQHANPDPVLDEPLLESMFDQSGASTLITRIRSGVNDLVDKFRTSFIYEANVSHFPSLWPDLPNTTFADNLRVLSHSMGRASRVAEKNVKSVVAPILNSFTGDQFGRMWQVFERVVVLRDLLETANRGIPLPFGMGREAIERNLRRLELASPAPVLEAAENHRLIVNKMRQELIRRGKLEAGEGYEYYFPHQVLEDLAEEDALLTGTTWTRGRYPTSSAIERGKLREPSRPYTKKRGGSERPIATDYLDVMMRATRRFEADNAVDDFITETGEKLGLRRAGLNPDELAQVRTRGQFKRGDQVFKIFHPRGPAYYRTNSVDDEAYGVMREMLQDAAHVDIEDVPELRQILAVGKHRELILPAEIADRFEQFYQPDPLRKTVAGPLLRATTWWKGNTIFFGLAKFFNMQVIGDSINMLRSNPAVFMQARNGRLDSPLLKAINATFQKYGTPIISPEQALTSLTTGAGGYLVADAANKDDPGIGLKVGSLLLGAGLGYAASTYRMRGSGTIMSDIWDKADEMGAINSGFVYSEEDLARRLAGGHASFIPSATKPVWERSLDTISTLLQGRVTGDPWPWSRIPAEVIQTVQVERENLLRLANYIQQTEQGIDPRLAAKASREIPVDYGKFTDFENRYVRGFLLPFYAFYRHNIPNWVKAAVGKDVGGKAKVGMVAVGAIAAGDMAAQAWNDTFFGDVERMLPDYQRRGFHIIMGNPITRQPYTDKNGKPMVLGWEMPYEQALEFFGLARPGYVMSELFGVGADRDTGSLVDRAKRMGGDVVKLRGAQQLAVDLLNPLIKEPLQIKLNWDAYMNAPMVPNRYFGTQEAKSSLRNHLLETFFRQYRETRRTASDISGQRFDPLTSAFGLGLPIRRVNEDRVMQGFLHEKMDQAEIDAKAFKAQWMKPIDDVIYARKDFAYPEEGEIQAVQDVINNLMLAPPQAETAFRYYMERGGKGDLARRWQNMSNDARARLLNNLPPWAGTLFVTYLNYTGPVLNGTMGEADLPGFMGR